jgi:hypothetical protein
VPRIDWSSFQVLDLTSSGLFHKHWAWLKGVARVKHNICKLRPLKFYNIGPRTRYFFQPVKGRRLCPFNHAVESLHRLKLHHQLVQRLHRLSPSKVQHDSFGLQVKWIFFKWFVHRRLRVATSDKKDTKLNLKSHHRKNVFIPMKICYW